MSVLNAGIAGNKLLADAGTSGQSALDRFLRDAAGQSGARAVILWEGTNDVATRPDLPLGVITGAYQRLIGLAHSRGLRIVGATLQPHEGAWYYSHAGNRLREAVNDWIRWSGAFDGVADFDQVLRDPRHPRRLLPGYDSGDHLHPNDAGYRAIAESVDLAALTGAGGEERVASGPGCVGCGIRPRDPGRGGDRAEAPMEHEITTPDGRTLAVQDLGDPAGKPLLLHMGTPNSRHLYRPHRRRRGGARAAAGLLGPAGLRRVDAAAGTDHRRRGGRRADDLRGARLRADRDLGHLRRRPARAGLRGAAARPGRGRGIARLARALPGRGHRRLLRRDGRGQRRGRPADRRRRGGRAWKSTSGNGRRCGR